MYYQEMSDYEISCEVGRKISFADYLMARNEQVNYCNSWADAGKLAEECKIALAPYKKGDGYIWQSFGLGEENYAQTYDRNPCRAICIVFLMMKGGE